MNEKNFVGIYRVIEGVIRDTEYDLELNINDAIEWAGDIIDQLRIPTSFTTKVTNGLDGNPDPIQISTYRGMVPCDFHRSVAAREYTEKIPMRWASDMFHETYPNNNQSDYTEIRFLDNYQYQIIENIIRTSFKDGYTFQ